VQEIDEGILVWKKKDNCVTGVANACRPTASVNKVTASQ